MEEKIRNKVDITICGTTVTIVTDEDKEYVQALGARLDKRVRDLTINNRSTKTGALILCAIEALDAAIKLKSKYEEKRNDGNE